MVCECGGDLLVIAIEDYPEGFTAKEKLNYNRVCDVQCAKCGKIYYSQPYDGGTKFNTVKKTRSLE